MHQESSRVNKEVNVQKAFGIVGGATGYTANPTSGTRTTTVSLHPLSSPTQKSNSLSKQTNTSAYGSSSMQSPNISDSTNQASTSINKRVNNLSLKRNVEYGAISNAIKPTFHTTTGKDGLPKVEVKNQREWINTLDSIKRTNEKRGGI